MCHPHFCQAPLLCQEETRRTVSTLPGLPLPRVTLSQAPCRGLHTQSYTGRARPGPPPQSHTCTATQAVPAAHSSHCPHVTQCHTVSQGVSCKHTITRSIHPPEPFVPSPSCGSYWTGGGVWRAAGEGVASPSWRVTPRVIFKPSPHLLNEAFAQLLSGLGGGEPVA